MKDSIEQLEKKLKNIETNIQECEIELLEKKEMIEKLHNEFELILIKYNLYRNQEAETKQKLFIAEKEHFKNLIGLESIKKIFTHSEPLISKIKTSAINKKENLSNYFKNRKKPRLELSIKWLESFSFKITKNYNLNLDALYENYVHYLLENKYNLSNEHLLNEQDFILFLQEHIKNIKIKNKQTNLLFL